MNNIYYDLNESDIKVNRGDYTFTFSSNFYKEKFTNEVENYIKEENDKINAKYNLNINLDDYLALVYYKKVEKRGFLVSYKDTLVNPLIFLKVN